MQTKMISVMKQVKDTMGNPVPVDQMNQLLDVLKSVGATHIEVASVIGHPNFVAVSKQWADAIHAKGMKVTWRCAHQNMEGLYDQPHYVGANRKPVSFWRDEAVNAATAIKDVVKSGDEWAIYPERTEGIFSDGSAWLFDGLPDSYAQAFIDIHNACKAVLPSGVIVGLSANNASEEISGWMPTTLINFAGVVVVDHYRDGDVALYESEIRQIHQRYGKPVYVQEGAPHRFQIPTRQEADAYFSANKRLADEGILYGFGSWSGWAGTPEAIVKLGPDLKYSLNDSGLSLQAWWGGTVPTPTPTPEPTPTPIPIGEKIVHTHGSTTAFVAVTEKGNLWKFSNGSWKKIALPTA